MSLSDPVSTKTAVLMDQLHNILIGLGYVLGYVGFAQGSWLMAILGAVAAGLYSIGSSQNVHNAIVKAKGA